MFCLPLADPNVYTFLAGSLAPIWSLNGAGRLCELIGRAEGAQERPPRGQRGPMEWNKIIWKLIKNTV